MDNFEEIHNIEEYKTVIQTRCIILFTANWCPDCMFIKPFIGDVAKNNPEFKYYFINRDLMIDLCKELDIMGIPSFVAYDHGLEIGRFVSKLRKTKEEIEKFIESVK